MAKAAAIQHESGSYCRDGMATTGSGDFGLSGRELNLLRYFAAGFSEAAAAAGFGVAKDTIRARRRSLLRKLRANNRAHAVALGYEWRLLRVDPDPTLRGPSENTTIGQVIAWEQRQEGGAHLNTE